MMNDTTEDGSSSTERAAEGTGAGTSTPGTGAGARAGLTIALAVGVGLIGALAQACGSKIKPDDQCKVCDDQDEDTFTCHKTNGKYVGPVCMPGDASAQEVVNECQFQWGSAFITVDFAKVVDCNGLADTAGGELSDEDGGGNGGGNGGDAEGADPSGEDDTCDRWNPGSMVTVVSGVYHVDGDFVEDLVNHPYPLTECDTARFEKQATGGGYKLVYATSDTLAYKLGMRSGDIILKLNNITLNNFSQVATALSDLYLYSGLTSYSLQYKRGTTTTTRAYVIDP